MKLGSVRIEANDDGTWQVSCEIVKDDGRWYDGKNLKYSANSLDDIVGKIKEAQKEAGGMKEKPKKKGPDRSVGKFIGADD